jgi:hypothetical protein
MRAGLLIKNFGLGVSKPLIPFAGVAGGQAIASLW